MHRDPTYIELALRNRRSLKGALADLRAQFAEEPTPELGCMIRQLEAEIAERKKRRPPPFAGMIGRHLISVGVLSEPPA